MKPEQIDRFHKKCIERKLWEDVQYFMLHTVKESHTILIQILTPMILMHATLTLVLKPDI